MEHRCCSRDIDGALMSLSPGRPGDRRGYRDERGSWDSHDHRRHQNRQACMRWVSDTLIQDLLADR
jgi:hypothetical protein